MTQLENKYNHEIQHLKAKIFGLNTYIIHKYWGSFIDKNSYKICLWSNAISIFYTSVIGYHTADAASSPAFTSWSGFTFTW